MHKLQLIRQTTGINIACALCACLNMSATHTFKLQIPSMNTYKFMQNPSTVLRSSPLISASYQSGEKATLREVGVRYHGMITPEAVHNYFTDWADLATLLCFKEQKDDCFDGQGLKWDDGSGLGDSSVQQYVHAPNNGNNGCDPDDAFLLKILQEMNTEFETSRTGCCVEDQAPGFQPAETGQSGRDGSDLPPGLGNLLQMTSPPEHLDMIGDQTVRQCNFADHPNYGLAFMGPAKVTLYKPSNERDDGGVSAPNAAPPSLPNLPCFQTKRNRGLEPTQFTPAEPGSEDPANRQVKTGQNLSETPTSQKENIKNMASYILHRIGLHRSSARTSRPTIRDVILAILLDTSGRLGRILAFCDSEGRERAGSSESFKILDSETMGLLWQRIKGNKSRNTSSTLSKAIRFGRLHAVGTGESGFATTLTITGGVRKRNFYRFSQEVLREMSRIRQPL